MALIDEINQRSKEIFADNYAISIGEILSMYNDGDLEIHPEFQRFFRWTSTQKTRLIESFLLNIPVPSIFVSQREDGIWDVVDGLQRLSTLFQFVGVYKNEKGELEPPLVLEETKLLPGLKGKVYKNDDDLENSFSEVERRYLKRAKLDLIILKKESDSSSKYELFQRLNTGGTSLSDQEVRNCLMVMYNRDLFERMQRMSQYPNFVETLRINEKAFNERYDLELVTRFICLRTENLDNINRVQDFGNYLDDRIIELFNDEDFDWDEEERIFNSTFDIINETLGDEAFCKYDVESNRFKGRFYTSAFEIIAIGLGRHIGSVIAGEAFKDKIINLWRTIKEEEISWRGYNASGRMDKTISLGNRLYEED